MSVLICDWATRYGVSGEALRQLLAIVTPPRTSETGGKPRSEAAVQSGIIERSYRVGAALWRNNSGAMFNEQNQMVRFGLGNDSKKINDVWKSPDLVGIWPRRITPLDVGTVIGQFMGCEVKESGWRGPTSDHEKAQAAALSNFRALGGIGIFAQDEKDVFGV